MDEDEINDDGINEIMPIGLDWIGFSDNENDSIVDDVTMMLMTMNDKEIDDDKIDDHIALPMRLK